MKFDFCIGNPPYQETMEATSDNPVYNYFMDSAYEVSERTMLITPARFLFNAGKTPKSWNEKMLMDEHFKVSMYEPDSDKIFPGLSTPIKGGVAVTYHDMEKSFGAIEIFTKFPILNTIFEKVKKVSHSFVSNFVFSPESYRFTDVMHREHPEIVNILSDGHPYDVTSNIFSKLSNIVFFDSAPHDRKKYISIVGRYENARKFMFIRRDYIDSHPNLDKYKLFYPKSNGAGQFGEVTSPAIVAKPGVGHTQTFISMGAFNTELEAKNLNKYLVSKFARCMLGILKVTQDNKKGVWKCVPMQDFTDKSDIDWSKSVKEIDQQLYRKYGLTQDEIGFIESKVKEME